MTWITEDPNIIDWENQKSHVLINPRLPKSELQAIEDMVKKLPEVSGAIWILSSGTESVDHLKCLCLKKEAFLISGKTVNQHIDSSNVDTWLNPLPAFHVGGLAIWARAHLSGAKKVALTGKWGPRSYLKSAHDSGATLSSLVPTQLFDLVRVKQKAPESLRAVFIGGAQLEKGLFDQAVKLGYPVFETYGMTEACSQVATAHEACAWDKKRVLCHLELKTDEKGVVYIKGDSLFKGTAYLDKRSGKLSFNEREGEWFRTNDLGQLEKHILRVLGRAQDLVKIFGELVNLNRLRSFLLKFEPSHSSTLIAHPDPRQGDKIVMVFETSLPVGTRKEVFDSFNQSVAPFEKASEIYLIDKLPKSALGKILVKELEERFKA
jgi:O-succinylbenzoic acid--CoA ligase